ncbi:hypothetical protein ABE38_22825 [Brevibacillus agri]|nr:hypothetical protein [Brevibacillus agri]
MAGGGGRQGAASWFFPEPQPARRGQPVGQDLSCCSRPAAAEGRGLLILSKAAAGARASIGGQDVSCSSWQAAAEGRGLLIPSGAAAGAPGPTGRARLPLQLMAGGGQGAAS